MSLHVTRGMEGEEPDGRTLMARTSIIRTQPINANIKIIKEAERHHILKSIIPALDFMNVTLRFLLGINQLLSGYCHPIFYGLMFWYILKEP